MHGRTKNPRPPIEPKVRKTSNPNPREHLGREREERVGVGYPDPWEKAPEEMAGQRGDSGDRRED
jgi:hypothetical protein